MFFYFDLQGSIEEIGVVQGIKINPETICSLVAYQDVIKWQLETTCNLVPHSQFGHSSLRDKEKVL